ncbi:MAG: trypsin-like peptidase domain-containing protein [Butyricicoccus sp.]|nr:trypsin-like peptidase domain-containing protein [Butyricicoccus sp.]
MQQDRRSGWYDTSPHREWYRQYSTRQEQPALKVPDSGGAKKRRKPRAWVIAGVISLCVLILIAASALAFAEPQAQMPEPGGYDYPPQNAPDDFADDFRDFFDSYYSGYASSDESSRLPRIKAADGVSMTLTSSDGLEKLTLSQLYERSVDSVVSIAASIDGRGGYYWGTGIIMTGDGYILTNAHVIAGTDSAVVTTSDGSGYEAFLIGEDSRSDIAVLKIDAHGLHPASFGISDELTVGDEVAAIGNPLGDELSGTMTNGIVSAINRDVEIDSRTMTMIQTNTAINEGNSGGPLLNMYGQVIGITNMKMVASFAQATIEGIGFAIPTNEIQELVNQLIATGKVSGRPGIGITVGAMPSDAAEYYDLPYGLYITDVVPNSDAYAKGIRSGDILTAVNGIPVYNTQDVGIIRDGFGVGDSITLTVFRDGKTFDVEVGLMDVNELY